MCFLLYSEYDFHVHYMFKALVLLFIIGRVGQIGRVFILAESDELAELDGNVGRVGFRWPSRPTPALTR